MCKNGFSLLEVMISLAIFSISLLGLLKLQTVAMRYAYASMLQAQAQMQVINFANELMLPLAIDTNSWQRSNVLYLPQSQSRIDGDQIRLGWQAYGQIEVLSLEVVTNQCYL